MLETKPCAITEVERHEARKIEDANTFFMSMSNRESAVWIQ